MIWMAWAGPPVEVVCDEDPTFKAHFRDGLGTLGTIINYVPPDGHNALGKAEANNDAWRCIFNRVVDQHALTGPLDVDIGTVATSSAKNSLTKKCGYSVSQNVFWPRSSVPRIRAL